MRHNKAIELASAAMLLVLSVGCGTTSGPTPTPTATPCQHTQLEIEIPQSTTARALSVDGTVVWTGAAGARECVWLPLAWGHHSYSVTDYYGTLASGQFDTTCPTTHVGSGCQ